MRRFAILTALSAVLIVIPISGQEDPFVKDGQRGDLPEGTSESGVQKIFRVDEEQPNPLNCDKSFFFRAVSHDSVTSCTAFNFAALYAQASDAASERAMEMHCKSGPESQCKSLITWRAWHSWNCQNGSADAVVVFGAACPKNTTTYVKSPSVKRPHPSQLKTPNPTATTTQPGTTESADLTGGSARMGCTKPGVVVRYQYRLGIKPRPASLQPYVDAAERQAKAWHARIGCVPPCKHQDFKVERLTWSWDGAYVIVDVDFIPCL